MMCEYKSYVEFGMKWILDAINQILKEDGIMQRFDQMDLRFDKIETRLDNIETRLYRIEGDVKTLLYNLSPDDLTHE